MRGSIFLLCVVAVTVYLAVAAWEDQKTCEITRWKHLIGAIPAIYMLFCGMNWNNVTDYAGIAAFLVIFLWIGSLEVYGMADGYVFAILVVFFGGIGGIEGVGVVIVIMIVAALSFMTSHVIKAVIKQERIRWHATGALVPHILMGYAVVTTFVILKIV